jgi:type II secretory pathway pseudopilin PulG
MNLSSNLSAIDRDTCRPRAFVRPAPAFTLVELLTVIFIIALLIGILVPSLSAARTAAKRTASAQALKAVEAGLQMFRDERERDFPQTNGYPPSYVYPGQFGADDSFFDRTKGQFPFLTTKPTFYGAMWLPAMLMGVDKLGYIEPDTVTKKDDLRDMPDKWYRLGRADETQETLPRSPFYVDPDNARTLKLRSLPGRAPDWWLGDPNWGPINSPEAVQNMTVLVDSFDYPILYYAANRNGRPTNMVAAKRDPQNNYTGGVQQKGPPYYVFEDNYGFTGEIQQDGTTVTQAGWDFNGTHPLGFIGDTLDAKQIADDNLPMSFARYVTDRKILRDLRGQTSPNPNLPLKPVNADSYLLISPGPDGKYGTKDDVSNLPAFLED